jgi:hypothetical protein
MLHYTAAGVISVSHGYEFRLDAAIPDEHPVWKIGALSEPRICGGGALGHLDIPTEDQSISAGRAAYCPPILRGFPGRLRGFPGVPISRGYRTVTGSRTG